MGDLQPRSKRLGLTFDELLKCMLAPSHIALRGLGHFDAFEFFRVVGRFRPCAEPLDFIWGCKRYNNAFCIESAPAGTACYLVKLARIKDSHPAAVVFCKRAQNDRVNRNVDPDAKRISTTNHR